MKGVCYLYHFLVPLVCQRVDSLYYYANGSLKENYPAQAVKKIEMNKNEYEVEALNLEASTMYKNYQNEVVFLSQEQKKAKPTEQPVNFDDL